MLFIDLVNIIGLLVNALGTVLIIKNSYSFEPYQGTVLGGKDDIKKASLHNEKNKKRRINQAVGFYILLFGFVIQIVAILLPYIYSPLATLKIF